MILVFQWPPYVSLKILFIEIMIHWMFLLLCFIEKYSSLKNLSFNTLHWIFSLKNMFDWIFHFLICFIESLFFIIMIDWNFSKWILNSLFEWVYPLWFCSCIFKLEDWVYQCVFTNTCSCLFKLEDWVYQCVFTNTYFNYRIGLRKYIFTQDTLPWLISIVVEVSFNGGFQLYLSSLMHIQTSILRQFHNFLESTYFTNDFLN